MIADSVLPGTYCLHKSNSFIVKFSAPCTIDKGSFYGICVWRSACCDYNFKIGEKDLFSRSMYDVMTDEMLYGHASGLYNDKKCIHDWIEVKTSKGVIKTCCLCDLESHQTEKVS
jgi:hypothetical protein